MCGVLAALDGIVSFWETASHKSRQASANGESHRAPVVLTDGTSPGTVEDQDREHPRRCRGAGGWERDGLHHAMGAPPPVHHSHPHPRSICANLLLFVVSYVMSGVSVPGVYLWDAFRAQILPAIRPDLQSFGRGQFNSIRVATQGRQASGMCSV